jgi:DnaJ-class molecular chaperone
MLRVAVGASASRHGGWNANQRWHNLASTVSTEFGGNTWRMDGLMEERRDYDLFGLPPGASVEEIQREYRRLVMSWHPDHLGRAAPEIRAQATTFLQELNVAYRRLTSPDPRRSWSGHRGPARAGSVRMQGSRPCWSAAQNAGSAHPLFFVVLALVFLVALGAVLILAALQV